MVGENNRHQHRNVHWIPSHIWPYLQRNFNFFLQSENPIRRRKLQYFKKGAYSSKKWLITIFIFLGSKGLLELRWRLSRVSYQAQTLSDSWTKSIFREQSHKRLRNMPKKLPTFRITLEKTDGESEERLTMGFVNPAANAALTKELPSS